MACSNYACSTMILPNPHRALHPRWSHHGRRPRSLRWSPEVPHAHWAVTGHHQLQCVESRTTSAAFQSVPTAQDDCAAHVSIMYAAGRPKSARNLAQPSVRGEDQEDTGSERRAARA